MSGKIIQIEQKQDHDRIVLGFPDHLKGLFIFKVIGPDGVIRRLMVKE